jgi:hypothetical protein
MKRFQNFAAFALAAALVATASAASANDNTRLADRAPALGLTPFTVEHGVSAYPAATSQVDAENPLADRAATLDGNAFTVKSAEGSRYQAARGTSAEVDQAAGNPLAERAATLGGKAFTVEHDATQQAPAFLARFQ